MKKTILIIEDELAYLRLLHDQLTQHDYEVLEATTGKKGLSLAKKHHPDLILLDLRMPEMDGIAVLDELRKDSYGKTAKVIVLTNLEPDEHIITHVVKNQPSLYLTKSDIQLKELLEKIHSVLKKK